jgi:hypothetical protein
MDSNFDFSAAIKNWRRDLSSQRNLRPDARRELEAHLRDSFAELRERGLNEEESFWLARKRIGELSLLNREFKKAMKTNMQHWAPAIVAWTIYVIAFFLPAYDEMPGWKAAILQSFFWPQALQGNLMSIHYQLLTFANLLMLASPFLIAWGGQDARFVKWLRGLSMASLVLVWLFLARLMANHNGTHIRSGCYLWAMSFVLLWVASLLQATTGKARVAQSM